MVFFSKALFLGSTISCVFLYSPLSVAVTLLFMSLTLGVWLSQLASMWGFYVMVLIFSGGMMILLSYACVLSTSEKYTLSPGHSCTMFILGALGGALVVESDLIGKNLGWKMNTMFLLLETNSLLLLGGYLLLVLFLSVKLTSPFKGAFVKYF